MTSISTFSISDAILSAPGEFPFFNCFIVDLISARVGVDSLNLRVLTGSIGLWATVTGGLLSMFSK